MKKYFVLVMVLLLIVGASVACGGGDGDGGGSGTAGYKDGTYTGEADGFHGPVKVSVEIKGGKIASVEITEHEETAGVSDDAIAEIPRKIVGASSTDVDVESGATVTSEAIIKAVSNALADAK